MALRPPARLESDLLLQPFAQSCMGRQSNRRPVIVMASAVRTLVRGAQSLVEEELQHRTGPQVRLFAS
jgi:hypothetical protein